MISIRGNQTTLFVMLSLSITLLLSFTSNIFASTQTQNSTTETITENGDNDTITCDNLEDCGQTDGGNGTGDNNTGGNTPTGCDKQGRCPLCPDNPNEMVFNKEDCL